MNAQYQLIIRHVPGKCPDLRLPFSYVFAHDQATRCPRHAVMVFSAGTRIRDVRMRIEEIKQVSGIVAVFLWYGETVKERDCWILIDGQWVKGD